LQNRQKHNCNEHYVIKKSKRLNHVHFGELIYTGDPYGEHMYIALTVNITKFYLQPPSPKEFYFCTDEQIS